MTIGYPTIPSVPRPLILDRNPLNKAVGYANTLAPATYTTRATYTVPSAKRAIVFSQFLMLRRATAAAPVGVQETFFLFTPSGVSGLYLDDIRTLNNTVDVTVKAIAAPQLPLLVGDTVIMQTADVSTGGTIEFYGQLGIIEFDV